MTASIGIHLRHGEPDMCLVKSGVSQWIEIGVAAGIAVAVHGTATELAEFAASITQVAGHAVTIEQSQGVTS